MGNIAKRLKKELQRNPQKAAALLGLSVVALILWGPKLLRMVVGGQSEVPATASLAVSPPGDIPVATTPRPPVVPPPDETGKAGGELTKCSWKRLVAWRDSQAQVGHEPLLGRDPFVPPVLPPETGQEPRGEKTVEPTAAVGSVLQCRGVVIAPTAKWAIFDGQYLREGQSTKVEAGGRKFRVRVSRIETDRVLLEVEGKTLEYRLPELGVQ